MARKKRLEFNGGLYHVINRGNYRAHIFGTDGAKESFVKALFEACDKFSWELSAFCLMSNHYHLCLGTPLGNLSVGMRWLQATYAMRFNKYRKEHGHLFQGRFKSLVVEPGRHWLDLVDYIHLNPARAKLCSLETIAKYRWTSLYHFPKRKIRPDFMDCAWMDYFDEIEDTAGGWRRYLGHLRMAVCDDPKLLESLDRQMRKGWSLGSPEFKKDVSNELAKRWDVVRLEREDLKDLNRTRWEGGLERCLAKVGKSVEDVRRENLSASWKLAIASKMKRETSVTNAWLAERLNMGKPRSVSAICGKYSKEKEACCAFARKLKELIIDH